MHRFVFAILIGLLWLGGCATARGLTRLDQMAPDELARYETRVALQVEVVAAALIAEGTVTQATAELVAGALNGLAAGTTAPGAGGIVAALEIEGLGAAAVQLAVIELDAALEERGAYDPGGWALASRVLTAASAGIFSAVADSP